MKCELDCRTCRPKTYCSWRDFSAYNNLSKAEPVSLGKPKLPRRDAVIFVDARRQMHSTNAPANIGGGIPPALVTEHNSLEEFIPDELNKPEDEMLAKEEAKKR